MKPRKKTAKASSKDFKANAAKSTHHARVTVPRMGTNKSGKPNDVSWHDLFIETLSTSRSIRTACLQAGVSRTSAYEHKIKFPDFGARWEEAEQMGLDHIEAGLLTRCTHGLPRKKFTKSGDPIMDPETGKQYVEVDFNETAVLKVLAAKRPGVWSDKSKLEITGKVTMTDEEITEVSEETQKSLLLTLAAGLRGNS